MTTLFKHVLEGMQENNEQNSGEFKDWQDEHDAIDLYSSTFAGKKPDQAERNIMEKALAIIIKSNGSDLEKAIDMFNEKVWG